MRKLKSQGRSRGAAGDWVSTSDRTAGGMRVSVACGGVRLDSSGRDFTPKREQRFAAAFAQSCVIERRSLISHISVQVVRQKDLRSDW
jgi:hypothetical protein